MYTWLEYVSYIVAVGQTRILFVLYIIVPRATFSIDICNTNVKEPDKNCVFKIRKSYTHFYRAFIYIWKVITQ
jgi:hypothetical protein